VTTTCPHGIARRFRDEPRAQRVLIGRARFRDAALVVANAAAKKGRLPPQPHGRAIVVRPADRLANELFEPRDLLLLAPEVVVEAQHLGDEPGAKAERQFGAGRGVSCGRVHEDIALDGAQQAAAGAASRP